VRAWRDTERAEVRVVNSKGSVTMKDLRARSLRSYVTNFNYNHYRDGEIVMKGKYTKGTLAGAIQKYPITDLDVALRVTN